MRLCPIRAVSGVDCQLDVEFNHRVRGPLHDVFGNLCQLADRARFNLEQKFIVDL